MAQVPQAGKVERPKYQVTAQCYLNERIYDPETMPLMEATGDEEEDDQMPERKPLIIFYDGVPAWYLKPLNEAAKSMVDKHKGRPGVATQDSPIDALTLQIRPNPVAS